MAVVRKCVMFLVVLNFLENFNRGDAEVCVLKESCILPCSFQPGDDVVIHWIQPQGNIPVHSYYRGTDQLARQNERFKFRTSLFKNQISKGNASLKLTSVELQDQARYKCYTSTITGNKESYVDLNVEAPIRKVDIQKEGNRITCSSQGIYPEPELTWSTNPPSSLTPDEPTVLQTEQQLYNITGFLILSETLDYSCTISSGTKRKTATLFKPTSINGSESETTIPCTASNTLLTGLIWRFNNSQIILTKTGANVPYKVSDEWKQHVKSVSESGSLKLQDLSSNQEGIYTCELSNDEGTYVTNNFMRIKKSPGAASVAAIVIGVIVAIIVIVSVVLFIRYRTAIHLKFQEIQKGLGNKEDGKKEEEENVSLNRNTQSSDNKTKEKSDFMTVSVEKCQPNGQEVDKQPETEVH